MSGNNDLNNGSVTLSDDKNRMLKDIDMIQFKQMQESDCSLQTMWSKAKENDSRYCISNELLYERSGKVDDPGLLLLSQKQRNEVLYLAHDRLIFGHMGISKIICRIRQHFRFPGLEQAVRKYVLSCP